MEKLKILVSAFACNPDESSRIYPGEDDTGWRLVEQIIRFHDVWVITHSYNKEGIEKALSEEQRMNVNFIYLRLPVLLRFLDKVEFGKRIYYYLWQVFAWKMARKLHREINFDLIHHVTFGNDWMPSFMGAFLPIPFIWGPVGGGQKTPEGLMREFSLYGRFAEKVRSAAQGFGRKLFVRRKCTKKAHAILVCNRETSSKFPKKYHNKIHFFPVNGIPNKEFKSIENMDKQIRQSPFRVLSAGRLHRLKGFSLAIKSFHKFCSSFPDSELVIVGNGQEYRRLEQLIQTLGLNSRVMLHPWVQREELLKMMHSCDVFLFSSFRDGGGAVVVEAMACGKPIICLDTGGPGFHVRPEFGMKISPIYSEHAVDKMAEALEKLYLDEDLMRKMGIAARKRAEDYYVWDRLGERMQEIYWRALGVQ